jgi:hypothetical protein
MDDGKGRGGESRVMSRNLFISQRILLITQRIAAGLRLYVLGTAPQLRHVRPSWASNRPSVRSCRLWRPTCTAAGHQEWVLGSSLSQSTPASTAAPCFIPASATDTPAPMDTRPSHSSQPQSLTDSVAAMEVDSQASHCITPMDCGEPPPPSADVVTRAQFRSVLQGESPPTSSSPSSAVSSLTQTLTPSRGQGSYPQPPCAAVWVPLWPPALS